MTKRLLPITLDCRPDEPCFNLSELNQLGGPSNNQQLHRFQVILVVRNDSLAEFRRDLGVASDFSRPEFRIPGGVVVGHGRVEILHTIEELVEVADHLRRERWVLPFQPADLTSEYYSYLEQRPKLAVHQSTFGPLARFQR